MWFVTVQTTQEPSGLNLHGLNIGFWLAVWTHPYSLLLWPLRKSQTAMHTWWFFSQTNTLRFPVSKTAIRFFGESSKFLLVRLPVLSPSGAKVKWKWPQKPPWPTSLCNPHSFTSTAKLAQLPFMCFEYLCSEGRMQISAFHIKVKLLSCCPFIWAKSGILHYFAKRWIWPSEACFPFEQFFYNWQLLCTFWPYWYDRITQLYADFWATHPWCRPCSSNHIPRLVKLRSDDRGDCLNALNSLVKSASLGSCELCHTLHCGK